MKKKVRTRFAPSPTGHLHIGGLRTALYSYALAKHFGGDFILRIEDTDKKREVKGSKKEIENILSDSGLIWDEHYVQSNRVEENFYKKFAEGLVAEDKAFYCQCKPKNAKKQGFSLQLRDPCRTKKLKKGAIKLKVPDNEKISYTDYVIQKKIEWDLSTISDTTILKSDNFPTYHLAVVVDDNDMKITHALRGYDWLPSTPIHLLLYKYLNLEKPEIGHLTDILDPEGGKLSKRKGSVSVVNLLKEGYLLEALLNYVMLLGWAPKDNRELFSLKDFVKVFDQNGLQKANPVFDRNKLLWMNGEYIKKAQSSKLKAQIHDFYNGKYPKELVGKIVPLVRSRIKTLKEFETLAGFFFKKPKVDKKLFGENGEEHLENALEVLEKIKEWNLDNINETLMALIRNENYKTGKFFMSLRIAITGNRATPPINESIEILGKEETLKRLKSV